MNKKYLAYIFIISLLLGLWMSFLVYQRSNFSIEDNDYASSDQINSPMHPGREEFCGGFANIKCRSGLRCVITEKYPDAGGTCQ